jgi:hypothetical protein
LYCIFIQVERGTHALELEILLQIDEKRKLLEEFLSLELIVGTFGKNFRQLKLWDNLETLYAKL